MLRSNVFTVDYDNEVLASELKRKVFKLSQIINFKNIC